jgi:MFS family permease
MRKLKNLSVSPVLATTVGFSSTLTTVALPLVAAEFNLGLDTQGLLLGALRFDFVAAIATTHFLRTRNRSLRLRLVLICSSISTALVGVATGAASFFGLLGLCRCISAVSILALTVQVSKTNGPARRSHLVATTAGAGLGAIGALVGLRLATETGDWRIVFLSAVLVAPAALFPEVSKPAHATGDKEIASKTPVGQFNKLAAKVVAVLVGFYVAPILSFFGQLLSESQGKSFSGAADSQFGIATRLDFRVSSSVSSLYGLAAVSGLITLASLGIWPYLLAPAASLTAGMTIPSFIVSGPDAYRSDDPATATAWLTGAGRISSIIGLISFGFLAERNSLRVTYLIFSASAFMASSFCLCWRRGTPVKAGAASCEIRSQTSNRTPGP